MRIYNTLSREIEDINPINPPRITVYTCGPTVYDYPHIGNWFTFIRYDLLIRTLKLAGFKPDWVMNITDVGHLVSDADEGEDKLEKGAKREGKNAWQVAEFYSDYFIKALDRLNISKPKELPKATEHIEEQIDLIKDLERKGYTYIIDDGVYYDTDKFKDYGKLAKLDIDNLKAGARIEVNQQKRSPTDFALWKFSPKDHKRDMEWPSPWDKGFPGWHIECSAMAIKYLGETIDIHAGGIDHIPVHHTNEIAQSEAATGKKFANYWVHMNHITTKDEKISKSKGNTITLEDIEKKGYTLDAFRLLVLESHYRTQAEFSWENLQAANNRLKHWKEIADLKWQTDDQNEPDSMIFESIVNAFQEDLDTPAALAIIDNWFSTIENSEDRNAQQSIIQIVSLINDLLGIDLKGQDITSIQKGIISEREKARGDKDWDKADQLRKQLESQGVGLRDTELGAIWYRL